jgi:methanogenic corrinoid protein MtbC1
MTARRDPPSEYFRAVETVDGRAASDVVIDLLDGGTPVDAITREVLAPAQVRVGQLWESGRWSVADEHVATSITESALASLTYAAAPRRPTTTRHVAVACVEGEWHSLPARMASAVAEASGQARVTMLGASLPAEQLHRRLSVGDIDLLALSCTMPTNLIGAARCIAAAHDLDVPVIVGGLAFGDSPRRARAVGADAWAADAAALVGPLPKRRGRSIDVPTEVLSLDAVDDATIALAYDRLVSAFPLVAGMTPYQQAHTREDLRWMARSTAAALLTDDPTIVQELLAWLCRLLHGKVPESVITTSAQLLADTLEPLSHTGAGILRRVAVEAESG